MDTTSPETKGSPAPEAGSKGIAVTHNGPFHADDVLACAVLLAIEPQLKIVRTRDAAVIATADIVFDVGGVYNAAERRFDHHQRGGAGDRWDSGIPFAAAGLVWEAYGHRAVLAILEASSNNANPEAAAWVAAAVDAALIIDVDGIDTGSTSSVNYSFSSLIAAMNPRWHEAVPDFDAAFSRAVDVASGVLRDAVLGAYGEWVAMSVVRHELISQEDDAILELPEFCPWQKTVVKDAPEVRFVVFPAHGGQWNCQTVPAKLGEFGARLDLPSEWAGLSGEPLQRVSGVPDAVFCHNGRFIAGAGSREGAIELARKALAAASDVV